MNAETQQWLNKCNAKHILFKVLNRRLNRVIDNIIGNYGKESKNPNNPKKGGNKEK